MGRSSSFPKPKKKLKGLSKKGLCGIRSIEYAHFPIFK